MKAFALLFFLLLPGCLNGADTQSGINVSIFNNTNVTMAFGLNFNDDDNFTPFYLAPYYTNTFTTNENNVVVIQIITTSPYDANVVVGTVRYTLIGGSNYQIYWNVQLNRWDVLLVQ